MRSLFEILKCNVAISFLICECAVADAQTYESEGPCIGSVLSPKTNLCSGSACGCPERRVGRVLLQSEAQLSKHGRRRAKSAVGFKNFHQLSTLGYMEALGTASDQRYKPSFFTLACTLVCGVSMVAVSFWWYSEQKKNDMLNTKAQSSAASSNIRHDRSPTHTAVDRKAKRILIIGPGFGRERNPQQMISLVRSGFQVQLVTDIPNPEKPGVQLTEYLFRIKTIIDHFRPDALVGASKGGAYLLALWQAEIWTGPTLMINVHPTCTQLPKNVSVVLAHGSDDKFYHRPRASLEALMATGSPNRCFLYYAGSSGQIVPGYVARPGDGHDMASLLAYDCLPRLIDAAMVPEGSEPHFMFSSRKQLSPQRLNAEQRLGYSTLELQKHWASKRSKDAQNSHRVVVPRDSEEFANVVTVFKAMPADASAYTIGSLEVAAWQALGVVQVERVENWLQEEGCARPYFEAVARSVEDQDIQFIPGVHTRWLFHGTDAIESIICNPIAGFQPLASGSKTDSLWGSGTYFARDAYYVARGNFCTRGSDGRQKMLMCLATVGMHCLGDAQHKGILPIRQNMHRYDSSVDSLSNPEICVVQHPGAAFPAYVITF